MDNRVKNEIEAVLLEAKRLLNKRIPDESITGYEVQLYKRIDLLLTYWE